jgi:dethiobiotin synthetase
LKTPRLFIVGTDTEIGKTTVATALLRAARSRGQRWLPYKPAVSGDLGPSSDHARLCQAASDMALDPEGITIHRFEPPIAPGLAEPNHPFHARQPRDEDRARSTLEEARSHLANLIAEHQPHLVLIEGAGGLHVPMPGGTWLPEWITALSARPIVVARAGLGTLNHTILTVNALRRLDLNPAGFILNAYQPQSEQTIDSNRRVLEARLNIACLGVHPHLRDAQYAPPDWLDDTWLMQLNAQV